MSRTLLDGTEVNELSEPLQLVVYTKCPEKYKLIDMETGEEYIGTRPSQHKFHWRKINDVSSK